MNIKFGARGLAFLLITACSLQEEISPPDSETDPTTDAEQGGAKGEGGTRTTTANAGSKNTSGGTGGLGSGGSAGAVTSPMIVKPKPVPMPDPDPVADAGADAAPDTPSEPNCDGYEPLGKTGWTVTARRYALYTGWSMDDSPDKAIDSDEETRYSTGYIQHELGPIDNDGVQFACATVDLPSAEECGLTDQGPGDFIIIDMKAVKNFGMVVMDSAAPDGTLNASVTDFPVEYDVEVSLDGVDYTLVAHEVGALVSTSCFTPQSARYIRISVTEDKPDGEWWSIYELDVYAAP